MGGIELISARIGGTSYGSVYEYVFITFFYLLLGIMTTLSDFVCIAMYILTRTLTLLILFGGVHIVYACDLE